MLNRSLVREKPLRASVGKVLYSSDEYRIYVVDDIPAILFALDPDQYEKYFPRLSKEDMESMYQKYKEMKGTYPEIES